MFWSVFFSHTYLVSFFSKTLKDNKELTQDFLSVCMSFRLSIPWYICSSVYLFVCLSVRLSICSSVYLFVCLSVCLSICSSVYLFVCLSVRLSICSSVYLFVCLSVRLSICSSVYLFVCLSVCQFKHSGNWKVGYPQKEWGYRNDWCAIMNKSLFIKMKILHCHKPLGGQKSAIHLQKRCLGGRVKGLANWGSNILKDWYFEI